MPVKVRCPNCERVLNAPDRARGKAIRCPQCQAAVRVPAEKVTKKTNEPPPSASVVIANLDFDRLEDAHERICPKCGAEVTVEDIECPECHVNLETGTLSAKRRAELSRKGPDPKLYFKEFFSDGIEFWKKNKKLSIRLSLNSMAFVAFALACFILSLWAVKPILRTFFVVCGTLALLVPPGLAWNLHSVIVDATMRKKKKLGKYNFDKFLGAALGLKLIFWFLTVAAPLHLVAIVFLVLYTRGMDAALIVAGALEVAAVVFASLLFPIAMTHMAMPVTIRGWQIHKMSGAFFRTVPAILYWCLFVYLMVVPPLVCVAAAAYLANPGVGELVKQSNENTDIFIKKEQIEALPKNAFVPLELQSIGSRDLMPVSLTPTYLPAALLVVGSGLFGLMAVFMMRTNGLYAHYFMDRLDLETMAPEVKYVPTASNLDDFEARKGLTWKPVVGGLCLAFAMGITLGGSYGMNAGGGFVYGASLGMMLIGGGAAGIGFIWVMFEAFMDSMMWFGAIQLGWPVSFAVRLLTQMEYAWILSILPAIVYGMINWSQAKFATVVMMSGFVYFSIGYALFLQMSEATIA